MGRKADEYSVAVAPDGRWEVSRAGRPGKGEPSRVAYNVSAEGGRWWCGCDGFRFRRHCRHIDEARRWQVGEASTSGTAGTAAAPGPAASSASEAYLAQAGVIRHPSLAVARLGLLAEVDYIQKTKGKDGKGPGYTFAGEAAIVGAMHAACLKHGLTVTPAGFKILHREEYTTRGGSSMVRAVVEASYLLRHAFTGESETVTALGEAADVGDKCIAKAQTIAYKYALRQLNLIETGDDPDEQPAERAEKAPAQRPAQPPQQRQPPPQQKPAAQPRPQPAQASTAAPPTAAQPRPPADRLRALDAKYAAEGLIEEGELLQHVVEALAAHLGDDIDQWQEADSPAIKDWLTGYVAHIKAVHARG
jgi:hypothetical protein